MDKQLLKRVMIDNQAEVERYKVEDRNIVIDDFPCYVLVGVRRAGKSYMLYHRMQQLLKQGYKWSQMLYVNFEDERLADFTSEDFNLLLECHAELYSDRPILFLDEIQNILHWDKFARRLADSGYSAFITGSNSKMLSGEVATTLGGRYLICEVYPYSLKEYLQVHHVPFDEVSLLGTESRASVVRRANEFFHEGGLPAAALLPSKRNYLSSVYQKIYLGDIIARNNVSNTAGMKVMVRKLAESVCRPISYNRLANILSSVGGKLSLATVIKYVEYCENAWLLLRMKNIAAHLADKESNCKYYFIDNGILNLFLIDKDTALLENLVALALFRKYGYDVENERVFFYQDKVEVDFYIPEEEWAIQVSYTLKDEETYEREVGALKKLPKVLPCKRRSIITYDESDSISDANGNIEVLSFWKWLLEL